jgi:hypothetical protein
VSFGDLQRLPPLVVLVFAVMLWPAIWAAAALVVALAADVLRDITRHDTLRGSAEGAVLRRGQR